MFAIDERPSTVQLGVAVAGAGIVLIVSHDGTPVWRVVRTLVTLALSAAAWHATGIDHGPRRTVIAGAFALLAIPVGIGVGVPHLAKAGPVPLTIGGLATLVGGLVLLVQAGLGVLRSTRRRIAIPTLGSIGVVLLLILIWTLGQAVAATNVPRPHVGSTDPADVGLTYRDVEFTASDGTRLSGWYVPSSNGAAVVLLHGAGSTRSNVLDHALVLARHGYGVLLYDARGHGRSGGRAMDFGWYGDEDIAGAVSFLRDQGDVDDRRIAAVGMSMGGEQAIGAAASVTDLSAVVAEGATNRVAGDKAWLSEEFGLRGALTQRIDWLTYAFADMLTDADPPLSLHDAVRAAAPRPVLLIAAGDVPDEARAGAYIESASPDTVELWVVPATSHTHALDAQPQEWEARVIAFLDDALGLDARAG